MATVSITIPNAVVQRVVDAVALEYHYDASKDGTKSDFAKAQVIKFLMRTVKDAERTVAINSALAAAEGSVDNDIVLS